MPSTSGSHFPEDDVRRVFCRCRRLSGRECPLTAWRRHPRGDFSLDVMDIAHYRRLSSLTDVTLQELSEATMVPASNLRPA